MTIVLNFNYDRQKRPLITNHEILITKSDSRKLGALLNVKATTDHESRNLNHEIWFTASGCKTCFQFKCLASYNWVYSVTVDEVDQLEWVARLWPIQGSIPCWHLPRCVYKSEVSSTTAGKEIREPTTMDLTQFLQLKLCHHRARKVR
jgi:hypothetical protein